MNRKLGFLFLGIILISLVFTGCIRITGSDSALSSAVLKSFDRGEKWEPKTLLLTVGAKASTINQIDVRAMVFDPADNQTIYLGTKNQGLYLSLDAAESWQKTPISQGLVNAIAIDPKDKCKLFALNQNKVVKSTDCARNWRVVYQPGSEAELSALAVDNYSSAIIWVGDSKGDLIQSVNFGESWLVRHRFSSGIYKILVSSADTRNIFVATQEHGLFFSADKGSSWNSLADGLREFSDSEDFIDLIQNPLVPDHLILASGYGLLKTIDGGINWEEMSILTRPKEASIHSLAINPQDSREIYYTDSNSFYHSKDGGITWTSQKIFAKKVGVEILVDPKNPNVIYLGLSKIK